MDIELRQFVRIACAILDIPVHENLIESLHVLFTLFSAFKENQFFRGRGTTDAPPTTAAAAVPPSTQQLTFTPPTQ